MSAFGDKFSGYAKPPTMMIIVISGITTTIWQ